MKLAIVLCSLLFESAGGAYWEVPPFYFLTASSSSYSTNSLSTELLTSTNSTASSVGKLYTSSDNGWHFDSRVEKADKAADAETQPVEFSLQALKPGDRVTATLAFQHAVEVAYFSTYFGKQVNGLYYLDQPSSIRVNSGPIDLCDSVDTGVVQILSDERFLLRNVTTVCPPTATTACQDEMIYEEITLETHLTNTTGISGPDDGRTVILKTQYEYGLYYDAPGVTPATIVSELLWSWDRSHDNPQSETGQFFSSGYLSPNKTTEQRKELLLKRIDLTGVVSVTDCLKTGPMDGSATDSVHFTITACGRKEASPTSSCEEKTLGPFGYAFLLEAIHKTGNDELLCRFEDPNQFCLMRMGLDWLEVTTKAGFFASPAAYTNVYEDINEVHREARSNTRYLPSVSV